ncbi:hypothetical protein HCN44_011029 [Aphidius gifuensis]|uniref:Uncharacterized protein n=1 Tax=Aphidius gifuensis TaxID=684658 RepID=A0A834Y4W2_APHGI|nr:hypothetical protein HCN44_011029 [Aphidius gifuensis]
MCYAEFASRVPSLCVPTVGEFIAFVIGWNLILEYVIGTASVARGLSEYVNAMINNTMKDNHHSLMPINVPYLADYPVFFAFGVIILLRILLCVGAPVPEYWNISPTDVGFPAEGARTRGLEFVE